MKQRERATFRLKLALNFCADQRYESVLISMPIVGLTDSRLQSTRRILPGLATTDMADQEQSAEDGQLWLDRRLGRFLGQGPGELISYVLKIGGNVFVVKIGGHLSRITSLSQLNVDRDFT